MDRNGCGPDLGRRAAPAATAGGPETETVEGGHDDVHKTREGGLDRRSQTRAEDSWERNAEAVAAVLDKRVAERSPELVLITGDVRAVALLRDALGQQARDLVVDVPGGARGDGVHQEAFEAHVAEALADFRARRTASVLDRFREAQGRGDGAVTALDDVIDVLRRGQVAELLPAHRLPDHRPGRADALGRSRAAAGGHRAPTTWSPSA